MASDKVQEARAKVLEAVCACEQSADETGTVEEYSRDRDVLDASVDALIAAVREDCAVKVEALPTHWEGNWGPYLDRDDVLAALRDGAP